MERGPSRVIVQSLEAGETLFLFRMPKCGGTRRRAGLNKHGFLYQGLPTTKHELSQRIARKHRSKSTWCPEPTKQFTITPFEVSADPLHNLGLISIEERAMPIFGAFTDPANEIFFQHEKIPTQLADLSYRKGAPGAMRGGSRNAGPANCGFTHPSFAHSD